MIGQRDGYSWCWMVLDVFSPASQTPAGEFYFKVTKDICNSIFEREKTQKYEFTAFITKNTFLS